jgi:hypothetical protein
MIPDLDLDTSWIQEQERMNQLSHNCFREPLPYIHAVFLYINEKNALESVVKETLQASSFIGQTISKELLTNLIREKEKSTPTTKYVFKEIGLFQIPLEPEMIPAFSVCLTPSDYSFFRIIPLNDIVLQPSIFIFHPYQTIYFLFTEIKPLKSILSTQKRQTKRQVKIQIPRKTHRNNEDGEGGKTI